MELKIKNIEISNDYTMVVMNYNNNPYSTTFLIKDLFDLENAENANKELLRSKALNEMKEKLNSLNEEAKIQNNNKHKCLIICNIIQHKK